MSKSLFTNIDMFIEELLHINDVAKNKLIDLEAGDLSKTYYLSRADRESVSRYILDVIRARIGMPGNTALLKSAREPEREQRIGKDINSLDWCDANGVRDTSLLHKHIESVYKELNLKGNNPLFLSVGALNWEISVKGDEIKRVKTPLLVFPIRLVRTGNSNTPIYIEFINDDIYINPCLTAKLAEAWGSESNNILTAFPHPNGEGVGLDEPVDLEKLGNGDEYLARVTYHIDSQRQSDGTVFNFEPDTVAIAQYNHNELCMYYDIKRNKERIYSSPLAKRIFESHDNFLPAPEKRLKAQCILPHDSVQERMISRVVNGESLIIKGPPGTGKTLTITNMIAALMAADKKVVLSSQKPAAMFEVMAKMPEPLRKFVMLLDSETEAQAAAQNPAEFRKELSSLLQYAKTFKNKSGVYDDLMSASSEKNSSRDEVNEYIKMMFEEKDILGYSYYEALDILCKSDVVPILFSEPEDALALTRAEYNSLSVEVAAAAKHFSLISSGHSVEKCPWRPSYGTLGGVDIDSAAAEYKEICELLSGVIPEISAVSDKTGISTAALTLADAISLVKSPVTKEAVEAVISLANARAVARVREAYSEYITNLPKKGSPVRIKSLPKPSKLLEMKDKYDPSLPIELLLAVDSASSAIEALGDVRKLPFLIEFVESYRNEMTKIDEAADELYTVLPKDVFEDSSVGDILRAAYPSFSGYNMAKEPQAPSFFDFKGKKCFAAMQSLGYGKSVSFKDAVKAVIKFHEIEVSLAAIEDIKVSFSSRFTYRFSEQEIEIILKLVKHIYSIKAPTDAYVKALMEYKGDIISLLEGAECSPEATVGDLFLAMDSYKVVSELEMAVGELSDREPVLAELALMPIELAKLFIAISNVYSSASVGIAADEIFRRINVLCERLAPSLSILEKIAEKLVYFGESFFKNYYTSPDLQVSFADLEILRREATDKNIIHALNEYLKIILSDHPLDLERFFRPFEKGKRQLSGCTFLDYFEHSVFNLAVLAKQKKLRTERYGVGDRITRELTEWEGAEARIAEANLKLIEQQCISRIRPDDPDFAFLSAERANNDNLRRIFKNHPREILKLKKTFILSPSSVSLFFSKDEFADFDVVIVDEASQLTPTAILPLLFRAKQVVLVGDEWQMPPIKHFTNRTVRQMRDEDGEIVFMNPDTSVLSLALTNCAFPTEALQCHYRSRTESLISFSQNRFYDYMRTFPTPVPKRDGLGFNDIYIENGYSDHAVNPPEAEAVVRELEKHFERYYKDGKLDTDRSVGVVAFGENQVKYIRELVKKNEKLNAKIESAIANYDDLPEKLVFFKTIETVQGQEIDHLILSLTYGKNKEGTLIQSFGELNVGGSTDKLGQCIFNVAVTRAKSMVTVIHSVKAEELTNKNIDFIADYLKIARRFSLDGREQFVGDSLKEYRRGFLREVGEYIESLGIDSERIVISFGATKGSVRIPIVILSPDKSEALLGIWCETDAENKYDYFDYNLRYFRILEGEERAWRLARLYIHDWVDNKEAEKEKLRSLISSL